jgi:C1A family cysteine protease
MSARLAVVLLAAGCLAAPWGARPAPAQSCVGDCDGNGTVSINELILGVNIALGFASRSACPAFDPNGNGVNIDELVRGVSNALSRCGATGNRAPRASDVSLSAEPSAPYVEQQLIGSDPDNDTISYELAAGESGTGYSFAYVNPESGVLYVSLSAGFEGTIVLPYRVTDGALFSAPANVTIQVQSVVQTNQTGNSDVDARTYAGYPRAYYDGALLGRPDGAPTLPAAVDLSADFPRPGDQGQQGSCVGWATAYALKTYQERVEIGWSLEPSAHRFSPAYIYNQINGGVDQGSFIPDAFDLIVNQGCASLASTPYDDQDFLTQPDDTARQEAAQFKGKSWKTVNGTLEIKAALANRLPVVIGIVVFESFSNLQGPSSVYNTFNGESQGGHAITIVGYDDNRFGGAFRIINSWSQNWGDQGYFWMPYSAANEVVQLPDRETPVLKYAYVLEDQENTVPIPPDPVDPTPAADLPNLEVSDWTATYDPMPRGSGALEWTVTNVGTGTAPPGAYVSLLLSRDERFTTSDTYVVYEEIPFALEPGESAFRDEDNAIAFEFPDQIEPGDYYMALWVDDTDDVVESNEDDNVSVGTSIVEIVNTLPDLAINYWYTEWNFFGDGYLIYELLNNGASTAPSDWLITLLFSENEVIGDDDEIFLFAEEASAALGPGDTLYRDESFPAEYSLLVDFFGDDVPSGEYFLALWLDPAEDIEESNEINNESLSWGTVLIDNDFGLARALADPVAPPLAAPAGVAGGKAYNGKVLPAGPVSMRKVRITSTPEGGRQVQMLPDPPSAPQVKSDAPHRRTKVARAKQQVIFPSHTMKRMPPASERHAR